MPALLARDFGLPGRALLTCSTFGIELLKHLWISEEHVVAFVHGRYGVFDTLSNGLSTVHASRTRHPSSLWFYSYCITASTDWKVMFVH